MGVPEQGPVEPVQPGKKHCKPDEDMILFFSRETIEPRRLYPPFRRGNPPDERKEGDVDDYIF